ncbi:hypothetical protein [Halalkalibacterium ligniniphilum]|uniref:hypothetical protein n=1 Tax=Halalkalibacterium ligniniphilum TaxID=1134413 RepID=UPI00034C97AB|nr:hypothetical protein [Halalkalibacterium ligniniphilum]
MSTCPVCNGFENINISCDTCKQPFDDIGRYTDYFDDYSPYEEIDLMKLEDGFPVSYAEHQCPHFVTCHICQRSTVFFVQETRSD